MAGSFGAALVLLLAAGPLSESMALRVTSGGLIFALGSVIIITYVISRCTPEACSADLNPWPPAPAFCLQLLWLHLV